MSTVRQAFAWLAVLFDDWPLKREAASYGTMAVVVPFRGEPAPASSVAVQV